MEKLKTNNETLTSGAANGFEERKIAFSGTKPSAASIAADLVTYFSDDTDEESLLDENDLFGGFLNPPPSSLG